MDLWIIGRKQHTNGIRSSSITFHVSCITQGFCYMNQQSRQAYLSIILIILFAGLACTLPGFSRQPEEWPEPTPETDTISFTIRNYNVTLQPNDYVPGTFMHYLGRSGENYEVSIDGLRALKRPGDSFIWNGVVAQAVYAQYNLRLSPTTIPAALPAEGHVVVFVLNPTPQSVTQLPAVTATAVHYQNIAVDYIVPPGHRIPGTDITYEGIAQSVLGVPQGQLSGLTGYPYLSQGDSFFWTGALRPNVALRYNLETIALNEQGIRLVGEAELWVWRLPIR
jgi:hypothetical protein